MYLLFRFKNMKPSEYNGMGRGEKAILRAFMKVEIEERNKNIDMFG